MNLLSAAAVALLLVAAASILWGTLRTGISPMPSSARARKAMLALVPASPEGPAWELGSGWGGLARSLAQRFPRLQVLGVERSLVPALRSGLRQALGGPSNLELRRSDFWDLPFDEPRLVLCYLYPGGMKTLGARLEAEAAPGTVIVSHTFRLPGWEPEEVVELRDLHRSRVYRYRVPGSLPSPS